MTASSPLDDLLAPLRADPARWARVLSYKAEIEADLAVSPREEPVPASILTQAGRFVHRQVVRFDSWADAIAAAPPLTATRGSGTRRPTVRLYFDDADGRWTVVQSLHDRGDDRFEVRLVLNRFGGDERWPTWRWRPFAWLGDDVLDTELDPGDTFVLSRQLHGDELEQVRIVIATDDLASVGTANDE